MTNLILAVIAVLIQVESGGRNIKQIGGGPAVGILQIEPIAIAEANRLVGYERWTLADRWNPEEAKAMCFVTLEHHYRRGFTNPVDLACRWHDPYGPDNLEYRRKILRTFSKLRCHTLETAKGNRWFTGAYDG